MSSVSQTKEQIRLALKAMSTRDFLAATKELLDVLGYRSDRILELSGSVDEFIQEFQTKSQNTRTEQAFRKHVQSVQLIFQVTSDEISSANQPTLRFEIDSFDKGQQQSFIFFAVELKEATYARGQYAQFTREINKRLSQPSVVLFRTADNLLTLAFVRRRKHRRDQRRDVLGHVSLIREIDLTKSRRRVPLDILEDLSLERCLQWMDLHGKQPNFDGLLAAWLNTLDTEKLNRRFYGELFDWFKRAVEEAKFPSTVPAEQQVIRLITRILFVWFIKEKGLVREDWFVCDKMKKLLNDFGGSDYYRAILQNLFFATLNTEMDARGFSTRTEPSHRVFSRFRYQSLIRDTQHFEALMKQTPFINGGLFDCLDDEESRSAGGRRIDMFSDPEPSDGPKATEARREAWRELNVPDALFFDKNQGLFPLLDRYKFTVEENTPIEQEVALDPELLGKVFENLLAAYNPETRETVRKRTGSYYTPRDVVDYMVEDALVAALAERAQPEDGDTDSWYVRLRHLLDYADAFNDVNDLFKKTEKEGIVQAIAEIKVLDPAVGSGAFPMAVLHKLTLALRRLDRDNTLWESFQKKLAGVSAQAAFDVRDQQSRDAKLREISTTFEKYRDSDFGRKLYLIQNSIYGVDVQTIACQIAKLRFFISLAIEQRKDETAENHGIKPLPNLETRFVAADTLVGLDKPDQLNLGQTDAVNWLEREIQTNRERHFHANTRQQKLNCIEADRKLRIRLARNLEESGFSADAAHQIAHWDPYDQNVSSTWFDAKYMFGVKDGFDVVLGNPPYIQLQKDNGKLGKLYRDAGYDTFVRTGDIYQLFYENGCQQLRPRGLLAYITSNSWLKAEYGKPLRRYFFERHTPLRLLEMGKDVFENAIVDTSVLLLREGNSNAICDAIDMDKLDAKDFPPDSSLWGQVRPDGEKPWSILSHVEHSVMDKMRTKGTPLREWKVKINRGITTGCNEAFIIDDETKKTLVRKDPNSADLIKPVLRGRDIQRYQAKWAGMWLINIPWHFPLHLDPSIKGSSSRAEDLFKEQYPAIYQHLLSHKAALSSRNKSETGIRYEWYALQRWGAKYHEDFTREKLLWIELVENGRFAYDDSGIYGEATSFIMTGESIKYLCAVLNGNLIRWFLQQIAPTSGMGVLRWKKVYVETIPIPKISAIEQRPFIRLVDSILTAKAADPAADTDEQEAEIDRLVYLVYGLTEEEISTVEGKP